ncbi:MAG: hypothetical protein WAT39_09115 [Planctomycetota bacterium]
MKAIAVLFAALLAGCDTGPVQRARDGRPVLRVHQDRLGNQGYCTVFAGAGVRLATGCYANGKPFGIWKQFDAAGRLAARTTMAAGVPDGEAATFHPDGTCESSGGYVQGLREGPWSFHDAAGAVDAARTGFYRGGVRVE